VKVMSSNLHVPKAGAAYIELYVLPWEMADASINLYGRGGTRICSLKDLQDFNMLPWIDQRLEGISVLTAWREQPIKPRLCRMKYSALL